MDGTAFFLILFSFITVWVLIGRVFDYRKARARAELAEEHQRELQTIREELGSLKEMMADVLLELDRAQRLGTSREGPPRSLPQ
jgi:type VI protein secretion system component VasK